MKFTRPFRILTIAALLCVAAAAVDTSFPSIAHAQQLGTNVITNANLTRAAAYTVKGNATSAAASVADTAFPLVNAIGSAGTTFTIALTPSSVSRSHFRASASVNALPRQASKSCRRLAFSFRLAVYRFCTVNRWPLSFVSSDCQRIVILCFWP